MKRALLLALTFICSFATFAQNDSYKYHFKSNLNELYSKAPALTAQCAGTYAAEALPAGLTKMTYHFGKGCGLVYDDATKNFITSGTYTIELYFRIDTISGYKKLIDFDSLKQDAGLYNLGGKVVLYPGFTSVDSIIGANVYQYLAITRDATSKKMYINANGKTLGIQIDAANQYKLGVNKLLTFFRDDMGTGTEQSKGAVAMIQISNYAMDSNTVKGQYNLLGKTLGIGTTISNASEVRIYPNPATDNLHIATGTDCSYSISDITGKNIRTGGLQKGDNNIGIDHLSPGQYILQLISDSGVGQYRFSKL